MLAPVSGVACARRVSKTVTRSRNAWGVRVEPAAAVRDVAGPRGTGVGSSSCVPDDALRGPHEAHDPRREPRVQVPAEVIDHLTSVVLDAVDERGLAPPQDGQAQGVQARAVDGTAVVAEMALRVDDRHVEPPVVGPESRLPRRSSGSRRSGGRAPASPTAEPRSARSARGRRPRRSSPLVRAHSSKTSSSRSSFRSASEHTFRRPPENSARPSRTARPAAHEPDAHRRQRVEVERRPLGGSDELRRR